MKRLIVVLSSVALMLGMAQCRKNLEQMNPATPEGTQEVSLTAGYDDNGKADIALDGMVTWTIGDKLYAVGEVDGFLGELTLESQGYNTPSNKAVFKGSLQERTETQNLHFYYVGTGKSISSDTYTFDISQQNGTLENIVKNMHIAHGVKNNVPAGETKLGSVSMHNMMAIAKFDISAYTAPMKCSGTNVLTGGTLDLKTGKWTTTKASEFTLKGKNLNFRDYYMVLMPSEAEQQFTFKQNDSDEHPVVKARVIEAGKLYTGGSSKDGAVASVPVKTIPVGSLPGVFTVSENNDKVRFSKGNLYAVKDGENISWYFEDNQYDFRHGHSSNAISVINNVWTKCSTNTWGMFGWSSDGASKEYKPWGMNTSTTNNDYKGVFVDWGNNKIENGGNQEKIWKTLAAAQLTYILDTRETASGYHYARAIFNDDAQRRIVLIFPDSWDGSLYDVPSTHRDKPLGATGSFKVAKDVWDNILEPAGVVMLPIQNLYRSGSSYYNYGDGAFEKTGTYWTADPNSSNATRAETLIFDGIKVESSDRKLGLKVRLVQPVAE